MLKFQSPMCMPGQLPISRLLVINRTTDADSVFGCDSDATRVV